MKGGKLLDQIHNKRISSHRTEAPDLRGAHKEYAERAHLIRWFHERETKELRAMRAAYLSMKGGAA